MSIFKTNFDPSIHGFHFTNKFDNVVFDTFIGSWTTHGRCGGMAYAALDYYYYGIPIPMHIKSDFSNGESPEVESILASYIYERLFNSFSRYNTKMFSEWTLKRDHSTWIFGEGVPQLSKKQEFPKLMDKLRTQGPQVIGLVGARNLTEIGSKNHQVVAYGYENEESSGKITIFTYDNNYPDRVVEYSSTKNQNFFESSIVDINGNKKQYRGFFVEEYQAKRPTYLDLCVTMEISKDRLSVHLGDRLECSFKIKNIGEYPSHVKNLFLCVAGPKGENLDGFFGSDGNGNPILPGQERTYSKICDDFGTTLGQYTLNLAYTSSIKDVKITNVPNSKSLTIELKYLSNSILNLPPFVKNVQVLKGKPGLVPMGFASFNTTGFEDCEIPKLKYNAEWNFVSNGIRSLTVMTQNMPITATGELYVFVEFETSNYVGNTTPPGKMNTKALKLKGNNSNGSLIEISVNLIEKTDAGARIYYWGSFKPGDYPLGNVRLALEITGTDGVEHNSRRAIKGDVLDANPGTMAYIDQNSLPLYPFINYEPGIDTNHKIDICPKLISLPADAYELNNSFAAATNLSIPLASGNSGESWRNVENLNIQNAIDKDFFKVAYQSLLQDDQCKLTKPVTYCLSEFLQLYITKYPPRLVILSECVSDGCLAVDVYKTNNVSAGFISKPRSSAITIYNPTQVFADKNCFVEIKNSDYNSLGALKYNLRIGYLPMQEVLSSHGSPSIALDTIRRKFLKDLFNAIDLPRPSDYLFDRVIYTGLTMEPAINMGIINNKKAFVSAYEKFILSQSTINELSSIIREDSKEVMVKELATLPKLEFEEFVVKPTQDLKPIHELKPIEAEVVKPNKPTRPKITKIIDNIRPK